MRDDDELDACGHVADNFAEATYIVLIKRRIHFVKQTEGRRIQIEDREHERDRRQRLLATGQQMNRAVALARRARHYGDSRGEHILAHEFKIGVAAAEEPWKLLLQSRVDALERLFKAGAGLFINAPHCLLKGDERIVQISVLAVKIVLALSLFLELVDRGEIHLSQLLDVRAHFDE